MRISLVLASYFFILLMLLVSKAFSFRVKAVNMETIFWPWNNFDFQLYWIMYFSRLLKITRVLEVHNTKRPSYVNARIPATPGNHSTPSEVTSISEKFTPCPLLTPDQPYSWQPSLTLQRPGPPLTTLLQLFYRFVLFTFLFLYSIYQRNLYF